MSDTDDTDELLLIPPDLFLLNTDIESNLNPYYSVVDSLIIQVNNLEDRVKYLQDTSEISLVSSSSYDNSLDSHNMYSCMSGYNRPCNSSDELPQSSQSTPQKPRNKFTINSSLPSSPNVNRINLGQSLSNNNCNKSNKKDQIDNFISSVKKIKRLNAVRNLENDFGSTNHKSFEQEIDNVNVLFRSLDKQKKQTWNVEDGISSYDLGMNKIISEPYVSRDLNSNNFPKGSNTEISSNSSEPTQTTAYNRYTYNNKSNSHINNRYGDSSQRNKINEDNINLENVSLSTLWKGNNEIMQDMPLHFKQRLHEEKLRRQHCEQVVQELQNRILELQEQLAVALQVDEAKDSAIAHFHRSWDELSNKVKILDKEKEIIQQELCNLRDQSDVKLKEANEKISEYEKEAKQSVNLAHECQVHVNQLENQCTDLQNKLKNVESKFDQIKKSYLSELEKNKKYPEIIAQKEIEFNENKKLLTEATKEITHSKKSIEEFESQLKKLKNENIKLQETLDSETVNNHELNEKNNILSKEIEVYKNSISELQCELSKAKEQIESNKIELKNYYQGQVEILVQSKLKEFQNQLEKAEAAMKDDVKKKELSIAKKAALHVQQLNEKHELEIRLLEQRHQEQLNLNQVRVAKYQHDIDELKDKMQRENDRNSHFYKQVYKFVESVRKENFQTLDELQSFRSKSCSNLEDILLNVSNDYEQNIDDENNKISPSSNTYVRKSSSASKIKRSSDVGLRYLIDLLLDKPPGNPIMDETNESLSSERLNCHYPENENPIITKCVPKEKRNEKRPWK